MITVVIGLQWGDEGKGKIIDHLSNQYDIVVRFQGGANAGHTVYYKDQTLIFHLLPTGIQHENIMGVIGPGVALDPEQLLHEIKQTEEFSGSVRERILIDPRCPVVLPVHKAIDGWEEELKGGIGTTKRGIGPAYRDHYARIGIRVGDTLDPDQLKKRLKLTLEFNNQILGARYGKPPFLFDKLYTELLEWGKTITPLVRDTHTYLLEQLKNRKYILFEGAQGTLLDIVFGTYPFVTSSHTLSSGALVGLGLPPQSINQIIGVTKAYTTRVGKGPFPTEIHDNTAQRIREQGNEYGATTGRPRRCGWLDLILLKYAVSLNGVTSIALTKVDVLSGFQSVKVATEYKLNSKSIKYPPAYTSHLEHVKPVYKEFTGWSEISNPDSLNDLPRELIQFIRFIENYTETKVGYISYGIKSEEILKVG